MIGKTLARYEILAKIGEGTLGEVFRARDPKRNRQVAIKILPADAAADPDRLERLLLEARTISDLDHPHITTIHSVEESGGVHFITMEILQGRKLDSLIPQNGFSAARFFDIAIPLVDSIGAAREVGVITRSLNPRNIMWTNDGIVKILRFGLVRNPKAPGEESGPDVLNPELREGASAEGRTPYASPEELAGKPRDHRSEMYSLGVLFYEMLTGFRPFSGEEPQELLSTIAMSTPAAMSELRQDLPESLDRLIESCLEKDQDRRPDSVGIVRQELTRIKKEHLGGSEKIGPSIVVLPFIDMSLAKDLDYLCDGITDALINDLGEVKNLRVVSRISSFQFKDSDLNLQEIGRRLDVAHMLKGTVKKDQGRLQVKAEIFRTSDGDQVWTADYDRELDGIFNIQTEIVQSLVKTLLSGAGRTQAQAPPTKNVQAYEYYLRGRKFYYQYRRKAAEVAKQMFSTAVRRDPEFSLAHAGIADCCCFLYLYSAGRVENLEQAEEASARALELAPGLAEVHASRGLALSLSEKHAEAEAEFQTALRIDPDLFKANYLYARHCFARGRLDEAGTLFKKAAEVSPDDYQTLMFAAQVMDNQGLAREAEETRRRGVKLVEDQLRLHPGDVRALYMGANALAALGEKARPLEWANLALVMEPNEPMVLYNAGCIYSLCGKIDDAIDCLDKAAKVGLAQKGWYENDSDLDPLRDHYRFMALMRWMGEKHPG